MNGECEKCGGRMTIGQILSGSYDVYERGGIIQFDPPPSSGKLEDCFKCETCGHSVTSIYIKPPMPLNYINVKIDLNELL